ncbi:hypothetical protein KIPB_014303 [Kipferlia bialata]|uniref:Uncharacterized protein n=1 Tax=Kipferlia bialata TaxID=797122 RepID=A0A9K3GPG5_9EUKA|nr:hypothetical protein KIPB_014303 [Kipferlia bialata]|eukprot:g14303.t1
MSYSDSELRRGGSGLLDSESELSNQYPSLVAPQPLLPTKKKTSTGCKATMLVALMLTAIVLIIIAVSSHISIAITAADIQASVEEYEVYHFQPDVSGLSPSDLRAVAALQVGVECYSG